MGIKAESQSKPDPPTESGKGRGHSFSGLTSRESIQEVAKNTTGVVAGPELDKLSLGELKHKAARFDAMREGGVLEADGQGGSNADGASPSRPSATKESVGRRTKGAPRWRRKAMEHTALILAVVENGEFPNETAVRTRYGGNATTTAKYRDDSQTLALITLYKTDSVELNKAKSDAAQRRARLKRT